MAASPDDTVYASKIQDVYRRIQKEKKMVEGFRAMANATTNQDTRRACESKIRDSQKSIEWFEQSLRELQKKQRAAAAAGGGSGSVGGSPASSLNLSLPGPDSIVSGSTSTSSAPPSRGSSSYLGGDHAATPSSATSYAPSVASHASSSTTSAASPGPSGSNVYPGPSSSRNRVLPPTPGGSDPALQHPPPQEQQQQYGGANNNSYSGPPRFMGNSNPNTSLTIRRRPNYTNLDLIKYDTPLNSAKISKMLNQLEFKLRVEKEYMQGIEKMAKLYQVEGDKKARLDAEAKRIESKGKKDLLEAALKRYKTLDIMGGVFDEEDALDDDPRGLNRRPVSGSLQITIKSARDLDHLPSNKRKPMETVVVVKVEDMPRARTVSSRTDRWNEDFEIHVDKANEVEVTIYDKAPGANETPTPIGMLWIRLSDVVDELRRKKVGAEAGAGWVTAAGVEGGSGGPGPQQQQGHGHPGHHHSNSMGGSTGLDVPVAAQLPSNQQSAGMRPGTGVDGIDAWFTVEPAGQIDLHLNFSKTNVRKRPYDAGGLGRQGAVRKRKEEVLEQNGHKFVQKQFYGVVLCAFCQEFLLKAAGMQCEDCRYTCHKKCYDKVVTKCVSKSNAEADKDADKINHRIPHRFEPITSMSPSWCCHCGQIVPLSRKKARKCSECGLSCHVDCAHLVPDFCGMSMEMARQLIGDIRSINRSRVSAQGPAANLPPGASQYQALPSAGPGRSDHGPSSPSSNRTGLPGQDGGLADKTGRMQIDPKKRTPVPPLQYHQQAPQQQQQTQGGKPSYQPTYQRQQTAGQIAAGRIQPGRPDHQQRNQYPLPTQQVPPEPAAYAQSQQQVSQQSGPPQLPMPPQNRYSFGLPPGAAPAPALHSSSSQQHQPQQPQGPPAGFDPRAQQHNEKSHPPAQNNVAPQIADVHMQQPPHQQRPYQPTQPSPTSVDQMRQAQGPRPMEQHQQPSMAPPQSRPAQQAMQIDARAAPQSQQAPPHTPNNQQPAYLQQQQQQQHQQQSSMAPAGQQAAYPAPGPPVSQMQMPSQPSMPSTPSKAVVPSAGKAQVQRKVGLDDFNFLAVLGKGNFGKVMLAEEKRTNRLWAIKVLKKEFIIENDEIESTKSEKRVFLAAARERHPFLLDLHSCFQTETRIYFVMEYVSGGDLMLHIQREVFTRRRARFYAAEVLLALEYFHSQGIIYRDLKLDNILLTLDGHIKVADYGLCKENMWYGNTTSTFCGTPEFMAPEILREQPYGRAVDWWAFGVLIYEMLLGQSPFRGDDEDEIFDAILEDEPLYPIHMPRASVSILEQLLCRDPTRRLGAGPTDAEEIKAHIFFQGINWDDIMNKRVPAPYFPTINGPLDTSNFDQEFTREQPTLTPVHSQLSTQDQKEFKDFSWIGPAGMEA